MSDSAFNRVHLPPRARARMFLWREWCFVRVAFRHFSIRALIMVSILLGAAALFMKYGGEQGQSFPRALFYSWSLAFGEPPTDFPPSVVLEILFFVMPIVGLTVIIEGIIDFALMIRDRRRFERSWCEMMAQSMRDHIIIVGFGRLGYRSYQLLHQLGERVAVIERDESNQFLEVLRRDGAPLFIGDARREELLQDANVSEAKSVVVATNDDLANLEIALDARRLNPDVQVVLRMFDQNMADKVGEGFDIHLAMSQSAVSAPAFAMPAVDPDIVHSFIVANELVVMRKWRVAEGGPLHGKTVADLMRMEGVTVVRRTAGVDADQIFPPPGQPLTAGDEVILQGKYDVMQNLRERGATVTPQST